MEIPGDQQWRWQEVGGELPTGFEVVEVPGEGRWYAEGEELPTGFEGVEVPSERYMEGGGCGYAI